VALLKADVEGAEMWVFQGAEELLEEKKIERICFENNRVRMRRLGIEENAPIDLLERYGYDIAEKEDALWATPRG
jgi:hypothetical protein